MFRKNKQKTKTHQQTFNNKNKIKLKWKIRNLSLMIFLPEILKIVKITFERQKEKKLYLREFGSTEVWWLFHVPP